MFFIAVELVSPSRPGQSAVPVGIGFIAFGTLLWVLLRYLLRKRSADVDAMPEELERRAQRVDLYLEQHEKLDFDARPAAVARSRALFLPLGVGIALALVDYVLASNLGIDVGSARGLYLLLPLGGWLAYPRFRGARYELTRTGITRSHGERHDTLAFSAVGAAKSELVRVVRARSVVGFYVTLTLESGQTRITLADLLAARPPNARVPNDDSPVVGDVLCWLWLRRTTELGLATDRF
jgi:hypothetical protein